MAVTKLVVDTAIPERLGQDCMNELAGALFAVDCQTCGKPLGTEPPALCLDDMMVFVAAGLHHPACRRSGWSQGIGLNMNAEHLSWVATILLVPFGTSEDNLDMRPMMLVNPGLEQVYLKQDEQSGTWRVAPHNQFPAAGLVPLGQQFIIDRPIPGAIARLLPGSIAVTMQNPLSQTFEAPADRASLDRARELGGVIIAVTNFVHPNQIRTGDDLGRLFSSGRLLLGWVGLHGTPIPDPPADPDHVPATYVLHWNRAHATVGRVLGHTDDAMKDGEAKKWAEQIIGAEAALIGWRRVDQRRPDDGWQTTDALSVKNFVLRHVNDGWQLTAVMSQIGGRTNFESDNEAKAWAAEVLQHRAGIRRATWDAGATTPGSTSLYTTA